MRRAALLTITAALAASGLAMDGDTYEPVLVNERVYAHCGDTTPAANVDGVVTFAMDTTPPAGSVQEGNGCGVGDAVLTEPVETQAGEFLQLSGTHTGNLDTLTLELHMIDAGIVRASQFTADVPNPGDPVPSVYFEEIYADVEIYVDGFLGGFVGEARFPVERTNEGVTATMRMTLTGIGLLAEDEAGEHTVTVKVRTADYYNGDSGAWVLDTTEVPTGIEFSPAEADWASYVVTSF